MARDRVFHGFAIWGIRHVLMFVIIFGEYEWRNKDRQKKKKD